MDRIFSGATFHMERMIWFIFQVFVSFIPEINLPGALFFVKISQEFNAPTILPVVLFSGSCLSTHISALNYSGKNRLHPPYFLQSDSIMVKILC